MGVVLLRDCHDLPLVAGEGIEPTCLTDEVMSLMSDRCSTSPQNLSTFCPSLESPQSGSDEEPDDENYLHFFHSDPDGIRTRISALKGQSPNR